MKQRMIDALRACEVVLAEHAQYDNDTEGEISRESEALVLVRVALNPMLHLPVDVINVAFSAYNAIQYALAANGQDASLVKQQLEGSLEQLWTIAQLHPDANL